MNKPASQSLPDYQNQVNQSFPSNPLVTTHISQPGASSYDLELFRVSLRICRKGSLQSVKKRGLRKEISSFSWASKRRLRFTAANAFPSLISQFGMTYHKRTPSGSEVKRDLNAFLTALRKARLGGGYLWILEFQKRGTVHLHLWLTLPVTYSLHQFLAGTWNRIAEPDSEEHLRVHLHEKNFIPWEMRSAGYLCKYIDKEHQKRVPEGFQGVGRFWGASRGLIGVPEVISQQELYDSFSLVTRKAPQVILRTVCKSQEKKIRNKKWKNWARRSTGNYTLLEGRRVFDQMKEYFEKQPPF